MMVRQIFATATVTAAATVTATATATVTATATANAVIPSSALTASFVKLVSILPVVMACCTNFGGFSSLASALATLTSAIQLHP